MFSRACLSLPIAVSRRGERRSGFGSSRERSPTRLEVRLDTHECAGDGGPNEETGEGDETPNPAGSFEL